MRYSKSGHGSPPNGHDPAAAWRLEKRLGSAQLIASALVLVMVILTYLFNPSVGAGSTGVPRITQLESASWASVLDEARNLRMTIVSAEFEKVPTATAERWASRAEQLAATIRTVALEGASDPYPSADEVVARGELLAELDVAGGSAAALANELRGLISELEELASNERDQRLARLEGASLTAVREMGVRNLRIAATGLVTALALTGLGLGLDRMLSAERHLRAYDRNVIDRPALAGS